MLYKKAAEGGSVIAQCNLASTYLEGDGVSADFDESFKWNRLAAEQGDSTAQFNMGIAYAYCSDSVDTIEAHKWYKLAADQGLASAQFSLGVAYAKGEGVSIDKEEAVKWYKRAAEQGYVDAQYLLGVAYETGVGVSVDIDESFKWHLRAAEAEKFSDICRYAAESQFSVGLAYLNGFGVDMNTEEGLKWIKLAADKGLPQAMKPFIFCSVCKIPVHYAVLIVRISTTVVSSVKKRLGKHIK
jgi:uncharacterized protein